MTRKVFYSFHYEKDYWRTSQVRNIGVVEGNVPVHDNKWEEVKGGGDSAIKKWISEQLHGRTCTIVLVGAETANRKWVKYEICESWKKGMGVVGVRIHKLLDSDSKASPCGGNPFASLNCGNDVPNLKSIVKCYDPSGVTSTDCYKCIAENLTQIVEEAIEIRNQY